MPRQADSAASFPRRLRYRIGCWLIRPHVTELLEHYNIAATQPDRVKAERCSYIGIGLRYAIGVGGWKAPGWGAEGPQPWEESHAA